MRTLKSKRVWQKAPHKITNKITSRLMGGFGALGLAVAATLPVQASSLLEKPNLIDKSTVRFEQTRFEHERLEQTRIDQEQTRFERLRARLIYPERDLSAVAVPASGTYLYGQQPVVDQPGTAYFVFESQGTAVIGALYMPSSSFDCVHGQIDQQQLTLTVIDSYSQEPFSYALPISYPEVQLANRSGTVAVHPDIAGFYPLRVRESDRALLAICQST